MLLWDTNMLLDAQLLFSMYHLWPSLESLTLK
jgi:hypothetical protein